MHGRVVDQDGAPWPECIVMDDVIRYSSFMASNSRKCYMKIESVCYVN